jgi:hypothetical protein
VATKNFKSSQVGNQNGTRWCNQRFSIANHPTITIFWMMTKFFQSPQKGVVIFFGKLSSRGLEKMWHAPFPNN